MSLDQMDELPAQDSEMAKTGSFACLSKQTITNAFECTLACLIFVASIYLIQLLVGLSSLAKIDDLFYPVGYISLVVLISAPVGLCGSGRANYTALFAYFLIGSYHLYALLAYTWFSLRHSGLLSDQQATASKLLGEQSLHQITTAAYTLTLILSLLLNSCKIISTTSQIEPARVIVVDNNPLD